MDNWQRHIIPWLGVGCLALLASLIALVPDGEWIPVFIYVTLVSLIANLSYSIGIKPIDSAFPLSLFLAAFVSKLFGSVVRYWSAVELYGGGDAMAYHHYGLSIAEDFATFGLSTWSGISFGSQALKHLTGFLYTLLPPTLLGSFFFFSTLALIGAILFYRAFRLAWPDTNPGTFRLLVFFLPSILYWPSSLGKESWIFFSSGIVTYGLARLLRQSSWYGMVWIGVGLALVFLLRPHFAAFMILALAATFLLSYRFKSVGQFVVWATGGGALVLVGMSLLPTASGFVGLGEFSEISWEDVQMTYALRQEISTGGESDYQSTVSLDPVSLLAAPVTILIRPFPWEANNPQMLVAAAESLLWLALFWFRRRILLARLRCIVADPFTAFCIVYSTIMIVALTTASNFGIIARQRVNFLPFILMLLS